MVATCAEPPSASGSWLHLTSLPRSLGNLALRRFCPCHTEFGAGGDEDGLQVQFHKLPCTPRADSIEKWSLAKSSQEHGRIATYAVSAGCTNSTGTGAGATSGMYQAREVKEKVGEDRMDGGVGVGAAHARRCLPADGLTKHVPNYKHALFGTLHRPRKLNAF
ncbi:hypothetical protein JB92DRAFT_3098091 [Gautieria morchelliformis]|nr:hypothetical protein JB92DRAFT_3098091 [Gautieria morchelliformis]